MIENKEFDKIIENLLGSEWIENSVRYSLDMELSNLELLVEKKEKGEISEYNLKEILDRNEKGVINTVIKTFEEMNRIHNIIEFEEEADEEKIEGYEGSKEIIKEKI